MSFPLKKGKNAGSNQNQNVQKYINFYRASYKRYERVQEDGQFGPGTEDAIRDLVGHSKTGEWGKGSKNAVEVSEAWYNEMLSQMRKAGWTPYGESAGSGSGTQSPPAPPATAYAAGATPDEIAKTRNQTRNVVLSLVTLSGIVYTAAGPKEKRQKRLLWSLGGVAAGTALYYGVDALVYYQSDKKKYIELLKGDLRARLAAGEKLSYNDATYTTWANQVEKQAAANFSDGSDEVASIVYKVKSMPDMLALEIAYGLRKTIVSGGWMSPLSFLEAEISGKKQSLREVLSLLPGDKKKDLNRHLSQFKIAPIA